MARARSGVWLSASPRAASANVMQSDTEAYVNDPGTFTTPSSSCRSTRAAVPATVINFGQPPNLPTGTPVVYTAASPIGGLKSGTTYYVIATDPYDLELAATAANAAAGSAITLSASNGKRHADPHRGQWHRSLVHPIGGRGYHTQFRQPARAPDRAGARVCGRHRCDRRAHEWRDVLRHRRRSQPDRAGRLIWRRRKRASQLRWIFSKASGSQTFLPITFSIDAATQTIVVSVAGGVAVSRQEIGAGTQQHRGSPVRFPATIVVDTTKAYLENATVTTAQLDVTADHGGYIGSLTAGAAGARPGWEAGGSSRRWPARCRSTSTCPIPRPSSRTPS